MIKENKLTPDFSPIPHTVIHAKGGDVNEKNDETGQNIRRNIIHLKKIEGQWRINEKESNDDGQINTEDNDHSD